MRKIIAFIAIDEEFAERYAETNGMSYDGPINWLAQEAHWLEDSGIRFAEAVVSDYDSTSQWERYIDYLSDWIMEYHYEEDEGMSPMDYETWRKCEKE